MIEKGKIVAINGTGDYSERKVLVIKDFSKHISYIQLCKTPPEENGLHILTDNGREYYASVDKINFCYRDRITRITNDGVSGDSYERIVKNILIALNLNVEMEKICPSDCKGTDPSRCDELESENEKLKAEIAMLKELNDKLPAELEKEKDASASEQSKDLNAELIEAVTKAKIFEDLYKELLQKR